LIFVGTGVHFGNPDEDLVGYLKSVCLKEPKVFAFFVTWGGAGKTDQGVMAKLKMVLASKGQRIFEDCFVCYGGWNFLRRRISLWQLAQPEQSQQPKKQSLRSCCAKQPPNNNKQNKKETPIKQPSLNLGTTIFLFSPVMTTEGIFLGGKNVRDRHLCAVFVRRFVQANL
jgi:hypothetical protein